MTNRDAVLPFVEAHGCASCDANTLENVGREKKRGNGEAYSVMFSDASSREFNQLALAAATAAA